MGFTELTTLIQSANAVASTATITPTANALVVIFCLKWAGNSADPTQPTIDTSGVGLTLNGPIDMVIVEPGGTSRGRLEMYYAQGASPTSGVITFDFRDSGGGGGMAWIGEDPDVPVGNGGLDAIVQTTEDEEDASTTAYEHGAEDIGVPLASFADVSNKTLFCLALRGTATYSTTIDLDADLTEFTNFRLDDTIDWVMRVGWRSGANLTPGATYPDSAAAAGSIAAEIVEEASAGTDHEVPLADDLDLSDTLTAIVTYVRTQEDDLDLDDAATLAADYLRSRDDVLGLTDTAARAVEYVRPVADGLDLSDILLYINRILYQINDTLGLTDAINRVVAAVRNQPDTLGLTDAATRDVEFVRTRNDLLGLTDIATREAQYERSQADNLGATDTLSSTGLFSVLIQDLLGLTDAASRLTTNARALTDTIGLTDIASRVHGAIRFVTDLLGLTDAIDYGAPSVQQGIELIARDAPAVHLDARDGAVRLIARDDHEINLEARDA